MTLAETLKNFKNTYALALGKMPLALPTVSFVVPVYNSQNTILNCIESVFSQTLAPQIAEIVIIYTPSQDNTLDQINQLMAQKSSVKIQLLTETQKLGVAHSRNGGIKIATGDLICFIDSDIILPPNFLEQHIKQQLVQKCISFSLRKDAGPKQKLAFPITSTTTDFRAAILAQDNNLLDVNYNFLPTHDLAMMCLTCAVTYWREDLLQVKGCPENFVGWGFNDTAMAAKVIALNRPVVPVKDATVYHMAHPARSGSGQQKWQEFAINQRRYQKMLGLPLKDTFSYVISSLDI
jgi:glycosyltransferase involved in cell wall biosynthesis